MTSVIHQPLVLPPDVLLVPVGELPESLRRQVTDEEGELALTRPRSRTSTKLVDAGAAQLLEAFRQPRTIVQAVVDLSGKTGADPEQLLESAYPFLRQVMAAGFLVPEGSEASHPIESLIRAGRVLGGYRLIRRINLLEDSELYQARARDGAIVALKITRPDHASAMVPRLAHEARILDLLGGRFSPSLVELCEAGEFPFLAAEWRSGVNAARAAFELREEGRLGDLRRLLTAIAGTYASLHSARVLHGDVHPGNVLVDRNGGIGLIDFGLAVRIDKARSSPRGGVGFFHAPELAAQLLGESEPAPPTPLEEQYSIASMLFHLFTGQHYREFNLQSEVMLRQILEEAPREFGDLGLEPWPRLEAVLDRALSKRPKARFADTSAFAAALAGVGEPPAALERRISSPGAGYGLSRSLLAALQIDGDWYRAALPVAPLCSVNFGAAGIAYACARLAGNWQRPDLLALADVWLTKAEREKTGEKAFANPDIGATRASLGRLSPYHAESGLSLVRAFVSRSQGNMEDLAGAVDAYLMRISDDRGADRDLALGRTGTVLGCCLLLDLLPPELGQQQRALIAAGGRRLAEIWKEVRDFPPIAECTPWLNLGIAHGWGGLLYTTLRWRQATGATAPIGFGERLEQLLSTARPDGRGVSWPWRQSSVDDEASMPGWCNGSAGMVHLACLAYEIFGQDRLLEIATGAGWNAWESAHGPIDLCCGLAGRGYALLMLYRCTGDPCWLSRARHLALSGAERATAQESLEHPPYALYKGALGLVLLLADLEEPGAACMPVFGDEGWSRQAGGGPHLPATAPGPPDS